MPNRRGPSAMLAATTPTGAVKRTARQAISRVREGAHQRRVQMTSIPSRRWWKWRFVGMTAAEDARRAPDRAFTRWSERPSHAQRNGRDHDRRGSRIGLARSAVKEE